MPQEFQVLQCYSCNIFQVEIVKKKPKWECKICREKQSVKQIYLRGTSKDCRLLVQDSNAKRLSLNEIPKFNTALTPKEANCSTTAGSFHEERISKWSQLVPNNTQENTSDNDQNNLGDFTFERPVKRRKGQVESNRQNAEIKFDEHDSCDGYHSLLPQKLADDRHFSVGKTNHDPSNSCAAMGSVSRDVLRQNIVVEHNISMEHCDEHVATNKDHNIAHVQHSRTHDLDNGLFIAKENPVQSTGNLRDSFHIAVDIFDHTRIQSKMKSKSVFEESENEDFLDDILF